LTGLVIKTQGIGKKKKKKARRKKEKDEREGKQTIEN